MNRENFTVYRRKIEMSCAFYAAVCEVISLFIIGGDLKFAGGLAAGTATVLLNLGLLEIAVGKFFAGNVGIAAAIYLGRLGIYAAVGLLCYHFGELSLLAFAAGVLGLLVSTLIVYIKEAKKAHD